MSQRISNWAKKFRDEVAKGSGLGVSSNAAEVMFPEGRKTNVSKEAETDDLLRNASGKVEKRGGDFMVKKNNGTESHLDFSQIGTLSARHETQGGPGTISSGEGDLGGKSYGTYQFSSTYEVPDAFVRWLSKRDDALGNYGKVLQESGAVGSSGFDRQWKKLAEIDSVGFNKVQHEYVKEQYYDVSAKKLESDYGIDINKKSLALKNVLWSNAVQHGTHYGAEIFEDAAKLAGKPIDTMTDHEFIYYIYEEKLINKEWSSGSPDQRLGLENRWRTEREEALELLEKKK